MTTVAGVELDRLGFCDSFVKGKEKRTNQQQSNWIKGPLNGGRRGTMPGPEQWLRVTGKESTTAILLDQYNFLLHSKCYPQTHR